MAILMGWENEKRRCPRLFKTTIETGLILHRPAPLPAAGVVLSGVFKFVTPAICTATRPVPTATPRRKS